MQLWLIESSECHFKDLFDADIYNLSKNGSLCVPEPNKSLIWDYFVYTCFSCLSYVGAALAFLVL